VSTVTTKLGLTKPIGIEQFSLATLNNNMDIIDAYAVNTVEKLAKGLVFQNLVTSSSGSVTDAIINNIASFTFKANKRYRIEWDFSHLGSGNCDSLFHCSINTCAISDPAAQLTGLTTIDGRTKGLLTSYGLGATQYNGPVIASYSPGAVDTTLQIKFRVQRVVGDDGLTVVGGANERVRYEIYEVGQQI
jgi:hypothetical protein